MVVPLLLLKCEKYFAMKRVKLIHRILELGSSAELFMHVHSFLRAHTMWYQEEREKISRSSKISAMVKSRQYMLGMWKCRY